MSYVEQHDFEQHDFEQHELCCHMEKWGTILFKKNVKKNINRKKAHTHFPQDLWFLSSNKMF